MSSEKLLIENFKLNLYEARVYLALLHGESAPRQISASSQVPLPRVYDVLRSLESKGFVEERGDEYSAISPQAALESRKSQFDSAFTKEQAARERAMTDLVTKLEPSLRTSRGQGEEVVFLRGINAISSKFRELIAGSKDIMLVARKALGAKEFFKPHLRKKGASVRVLIPTGTLLTKDDLRFVNGAGLEVRQTENLFLDIMVAGDNVMIGVPDPTSEERYHSIAVLIISGPFARSVRESLASVWKSARQIRPRIR